MGKRISKKPSRNAYAAAVTALVLTVLVLLNVIAVQLSKKYPLTADMTAGGSLTLSDENREFIESVSDAVTVTVMCSEGELLSPELLSDSYITDPGNGRYALQAAMFLSDYHKLNGNITVRYAEAGGAEYSAVTAAYPEESINAGDIVVSSGDNYKILTASDLLELAASDLYGGYVAAGSRVESAVSGAIRLVTAGERIAADIITCDGGASLPALAALLRQNGCDVNTTAELSAKGFSENSKIAVIAAPKTDYSEAEIDSLREYLYNGGEYGRALLYIASAAQGDTPNIDGFLREWGIAVLPEVVVESDSARYVPGDNSFTFFDYADNDSAASLAANGLNCYTRYTRAVEVSDDVGDAITVNELLTLPETCALTDISDVSDFDWDSAPRGPFCGAALSRREEGGKASNVAVIGTEYFYDSGIIDVSAAGNREFTVNLINAVTGREVGGEAFDTRVIRGDTFILPQSATTAIKAIFMFTLPIAVLVVGIGVTVWRKRK